MTYLRRALKYLIQLTLIFILLIAVLMLAGMIPMDVALAFRKGWESVFFILGLFAVMAAVYPLFGYGKRMVRVNGEPAEWWPVIDEAMALRNYRMAEEGPDGSRRYRLQSPVSRAARLWEDSITLTPVLGGFQAEGLQRDLSRVISTLQYKLSNHE